MVSNPANLTFDIREDEEQFQRLQDCIDVLVASGYFRARIKGLSAFDKIVGGMTWCLSICNFSVDVDLFYSESATIGQKIALTEKIVTVLTQLQCPHPLEPHQIQGLDFRHIFPVIQWLVKKAIETKKELGDDITAYCDYVVEGKKSKEQTPQKMKFDSLVANTAPQRVRKRGPNTKPKTLSQDAACTIAEFDSVMGTTSYTDYEDNVEGLTEQLEDSNLRDRISKSKFKNIMENVNLTSEQRDPVEELKRKIQQVHQETKVMEQYLEEARKNKNELEESTREKREEEQRKQEILSRYPDSEIEQVRKLLKEYEQAVKREKSFKTACKEEMIKMEEELEQIQHFDELSDENKTVAEQELEEEVNQLTSQVAEKRLELAELTKETSSYQRLLDNIPSQLEMTQYQQRFIELYNQMASKHRQTKQYITLHNALIDIHSFMKKEIGMLNKMEEVLPEVAKEANQDSFLQSLHEILRGLEGGHEKLNQRSSELEKKKNQLTMELSALRDCESRFHWMSEEFKEACQCSDKLHQLINE